MNSPQNANTSNTQNMAATVSQNITRPNRVETSTGCRPLTISPIAPYVAATARCLDGLPLRSAA